MLNEIRHTQKDEYRVFSHIESIYKKHMCIKYLRHENRRGTVCKRKGTCKSRERGVRIYRG